MLTTLQENGGEINVYVKPDLLIELVALDPEATLETILSTAGD